MVFPLLTAAAFLLAGFNAQIAWAQGTPTPTASPVSTFPVWVYLPDDEIILPPFLQQFQGAEAVNVSDPIASSIPPVSGEPAPSGTPPRKHEVKAGEWLEHGNRFDLPARVALQILFNENCQVVTGGALQIKLSEVWWNSNPVANQSPVKAQLDRGWLKVWVKKEGSAKRPFQLETPQGTFRAEEAEFWVLIQSENTEIYLVSGEMEGPAGAILKGKTYTAWAPGGKKLFSKEWDEKPLEVRINALYPALVQLAEKAQKDWQKGTVKDRYSHLRVNGPRRHTRFHPIKN